MSIPTWPDTLPQNLLMDSYEETAPDVLIKSNMETGPAKVRRRVTASVRPVKGHQIMTQEQLGIFKAFFNDTLYGGSMRFTWTDPTDDDPVEMRFVDAPTWSSQDGYYRVSMNMEILP